MPVFKVRITTFFLAGGENRYRTLPILSEILIEICFGQSFKFVIGLDSIQQNFCFVTCFTFVCFHIGIALMTEDLSVILIAVF